MPLPQPAAQDDTLSELLKLINRQLTEKGLKVEKASAAVIDATIIQTAGGKQRQAIEVDEEGQISGQTTPSKDKDARWTKKNGLYKLGYKQHTCTDEEGYIEINEYPRADEATVHWTDDARSETIRVGRREDALRYEVADMQHYLDMRQGGGDGVPPSLREAGVETPVPDDEVRQLTLSRDVMSVLTEVRRQWGLVYPGE